MGLFDFLRKNKPQKSFTYAEVLNGHTPVFSQFGKDIYASDVVQQCLNCITAELKKLSPTHVKQIEMDTVPARSKLQKLLNNPNPQMTTSDFIEKVVWNLLLNYNSFIVPTSIIKPDGSKEWTGLYPVQPHRVEFQKNSFNELFVHMQFANGYETTLRYDDIIHVKYRFSVNEFLGGNYFGQPDNLALLKTLELNDTLLQGVEKGLKSSYQISGVVKYNSLLDDGKTENALKKLEEQLENGESGFLPLDLKADFIPFDRQIQLVDNDTLQFIDSKILRQFGVNLAILSGDYTKEQFEAFYQKTLEPIVISLSQAFTATLFTQREKDLGNEIKFLPHELIFMSTDQKISLFDILVDSGSCYKNEIRTAFGLPPLTELGGQLAVSSNYLNGLNNKEEEEKDDVENDI